MYWADQKAHSDFSMKSYGKMPTNVLANPGCWMNEWRHQWGRAFGVRVLPHRLLCRTCCLLRSGGSWVPEGHPGRDAGNLAVEFGVGLLVPRASRLQMKRLSCCPRPGQKTPGSGQRMALHGLPRARSPCPRASSCIRIRGPRRSHSRERERAPGSACPGLYLLVREKEPKSKPPASSYELEMEFEGA